MQIYEAEPSKRKRALKKIIKSKYKTLGSVFKISRALELLFIAAACIMGVCNIVYAALNRDAISLLALSYTCIIPYAVSFIPAAVYKTAAGQEYSSRSRETLSVNEEGLVYSYRDRRAGLTDAQEELRVLFRDIARCSYDDKTMLFTVSGRCRSDYYEDGELKFSDPLEEIIIPDIFPADLKNILANNR